MSQTFKKDLTDKHFGNLTIIEFVQNDNRHSYWRCKCECGNEVITRADALLSGTKVDCGCSFKNRLVGKKFGRLTVIAPTKSRNGQPFWRCQCDCGNVKEISGKSLKDGDTKSCGCLQKELATSRINALPKRDQIENLIGKHFNYLTVVEFVSSSNGRTLWKCKCDCGKVTTVDAPNLKSGSVKSCGCWRKQRLTEHSGKHTRLYRIWKGMKSRCYNPNATRYHIYGGRGISVCSEWRNDFTVFRNWALSHGYDDTLTIDRINVDEDYCPANCQWLTNSENSKKSHEDRKKKKQQST